MTLFIGTAASVTATSHHCDLEPVTAPRAPIVVWWCHARLSDTHVTFIPPSGQRLELMSNPPNLDTDLLASWPPPPAGTANLDAVPQLLPTTLLARDGSALRTEYEGDPPDLHDYVQYWAGPDNASVAIQTDLLQGPSIDGQPVRSRPGIEHSSRPPWKESTRLCSSTQQAPCGSPPRVSTGARCSKWLDHCTPQRRTGWLGR